MLNTESVFEALREVKRLAATLPKGGQIIFLSNDYLEEYIVSDDVFKVTERIEKNWSEIGFGDDPQGEASNYKGFMYERFEWFKHHPGAAPRSKVWKSQKLIRKAIEVEPEYSVSFTIVTA